MYEKNWSEQEQTCYRTGFTQPKKQKRGPVSVLLVLVIFFGGINTAFRLLNIRLFREITSDAAIAPASVQFSGKTRAASGHVDSLQDIRVVDTTGAGDIFGGAALSQILQTGKRPADLTGEELFSITRFACTAAGLSTTQAGGISSVPTLAQVQERMKS